MTLVKALFKFFYKIKIQPFIRPIKMYCVPTIRGTWDIAMSNISKSSPSKSQYSDEEEEKKCLLYLPPRISVTLKRDHGKNLLLKIHFMDQQY